jgi:hypothetical protein
MRQAAEPWLFQQQLASAAEPERSKSPRQRERLHELDVQATLRMLRQLPLVAAGLPGLPFLPAELCSEESRWHCMQATGGGGGTMAAAATVAVAGLASSASIPAPPAPGGATTAFDMRWH